jgi:hypothetical protein
MSATPTLPVPSGAHDASGQPASEAVQPAMSLRARYLQALTWAFVLFSSARVVSYLPTLWALCQSGDSSQHSVWTWGTWVGANLTMAAWLYEQQGQRWSRAVTVSLINAVMCVATLTVIVALRF